MSRSEREIEKSDVASVRDMSALAVRVSKVRNRPPPSGILSYAVPRTEPGWTCNDGRRKKADIAIRVMVTAKERAEIRKAANRAAMPMSVYVRAKALEAARAG